MNAMLQHRAPSTRTAQVSHKHRTDAVPDFDRIRRSVDSYLEKAADARKRLLEGPYDAKALHAWRVNLRRVTATLKGLAKLSDDDLDDVFNYLRHCREATGQCRDIDILAQETLPTFLSEQPATSETARVQEATSNRQQLWHQHAVAALRKTSLTTPIRAWRHWVASIDPPTNRLIRSAAANVIESRYASLKKRAAKLDGGRKRLHRLRTATKKLRYSMELYQSLFPKRAVEHWLEQLADLQTHLGLAHDRMMGRDLVADPNVQNDFPELGKRFRRWAKRTAFEAAELAVQSLHKLDKLGHYWRK